MLLIKVSMIIISIAVCDSKTYDTNSQDLDKNSTSFKENKNLDLKGFINMRKKWDKVFKNGPNKICGRQSLKN